MLNLFASSSIEETNIVDVQAINDAVDDVVSNPGIIKVWLSSLPQKGFDLLIRCVLAAIFIVIGILITNLLRKIVKKAMSKMNADVAALSFVDSVIKFFCYIFILLIILVRFGVDAASIVAVVGSMGLTAGMAMQGALQNFAGGLILLFIKPFAIGDYIHENSKGYEGTVTDIGLVYTEITTIDNRLIYIPNGVLANSPIDNFTGKPERVLDETIGVSYTTDIKKAKKVIADVLNQKGDIKTSNVDVFVDRFGSSEIIIRFRATIKSEDFIAYKHMIFERLKYAFDQNGIDIPFSQVDVHMK